MKLDKRYKSTEENTYRAGARGEKIALVQKNEEEPGKYYHFPTLQIDEITSECTRLNISSSHKYSSIWIYQKGGKSILSWPGGNVDIYVSELSSEKSSQEEGELTVDLTMPGKVVEVKVKEGDKVKKGDCLLVVEAMKMENNILSPQDAIVKKLHVKKEEHLEAGSILVSLEKP